MPIRRRPACGVVDEVDAHGADDLAVAHEQMGNMTGLEFVGVVFVVGLPRQQGREDRITTDGVIGAQSAGDRGGRSV